MHIAVPRHFRSRPTTDFAKEALFNIIANDFRFDSLKVLDLFSGTGSIGYEFASRGAEKIDMVEINQGYSDFIRKTAIRLGLKQITIYHQDVFKLIPRLKDKYDIIFADPPYDLGRIPEIPEIIFNHNLLGKYGWFILEHGKDHDFSNHTHFKELRKYGSVCFSVFG
jgi:16S rRNA (guanine966-N2)-methyltransferase